MGSALAFLELINNSRTRPLSTLIFVVHIVGLIVFKKTEILSYLFPAFLALFEAQCCMGILTAKIQYVYMFSFPILKQ